MFARLNMGDRSLPISAAGGHVVALPQMAGLHYRYTWTTQGVLLLKGG